MSVTYTTREARRLLGMRLLAQGRGVNDVARSLDVPQSTVSGWKARLAQDGPQAVKDRPRSGRPKRLTPEQVDQLREALDAGPLAAGYRTDLWTLPRIRQLIHDRFDVDFNVNYLGTFIKRLGYSRQKPATQARQQDPAEVERFRTQTWPEVLKKGSRGCCHSDAR
jgi:transposase